MNNYKKIELGAHMSAEQAMSCRGQNLGDLCVLRGKKFSNQKSYLTRFCILPE